MAKPIAFKIEWDAHEYEHKERSSDWFWAVGIVTFAIAITAVIFGNVIFAILILTAAFALTLFINRPPEDVHVVIDEKGITKRHIHYPYSTIKSFWIDVEHPHNKIILRSEKLLMPLIVVPLGDEVDTEALEEVLEKHLAKEFHALPFVERLLEYFGF